MRRHAEASSAGWSHIGETNLARAPRRGVLALACACASLIAVTVLSTSPATAAECPNEQFRVGPAAALPECRAYEQISPVDKNGGSVNEKQTVYSEPSGNALIYSSTASFAGAPGSPTFNRYISRRNGPEWGTEAADAPQSNPHGFVISVTPGISAELDHTVQVSKLALAPGAIEGGSNVYLRDNLTGTRTLIAASEGNGLYGQFSSLGGSAYVEATPDLSHIVLASSFALTPDALEGVPNIYDYTAGELHLVNHLPNGSVDPSGAHAGAYNLPGQHIISEDGSRIFFMLGGSSTNPGQLYMREDGVTTVPISASQRAENTGFVAEAQFAGASADGSAVYFTSEANLTEASETHSSRTLYRYSVETGELTDLTADPGDPEGPRVQNVFGLSKDGSYVYFAAQAALAEGAEATTNMATNLYAWHNGQTRYIGRTTDGEPEFGGPVQKLVSPNGLHLAFAVYSPMTEADVPSPKCAVDPAEGNAPESCRDVYDYDYASGHLTCLSCNGPGEGNSVLGGQDFHETAAPGYYPRAVLNDGTVFFDTPNRLVPHDVNGVGDVYAWRDGELMLVSTGTSERPSNFADATPDASSIFFRTGQPLVGQDTDLSVDLYDARVDGGLAGQNPPGAPPPCEGEECRGASPAPPSGPSVASSSAKGRNGLSARCLRLSTKSRQRRQRAGKLESAARGATGKRARHLRRKAKQEREKARRLNKLAHHCGGQG